MDTPDFDWNHARAFLAVINHGSLTAAAAALGSSQPTVGRHVAAFERELGATLFTRAGGGLQPTPAALEVAVQVRAMHDAAHRVALSAAGRATDLAGLVRISASEGACVALLPPILADVRRRYPEIRVELVATNLPSDLARREADLAVRNFRPKDPDLVARKIRDATARFYASPAYLERLGRRALAAADLLTVDLLAFEPREGFVAGLNAYGVPITDAHVAMSSASHLAVWALARADAGLCMLMEELGDPDPRLARVPGDLPTFPFPIWLTCRRELRTTPRYRVVFDALAAGLA